MSCIDEIAERRRLLIKLGMTEPNVSRLAIGERNTVARIEAMLAYAKTKKPTNLPGFLYTLLNNRYDPPVVADILSGRRPRTSRRTRTGVRTKKRTAVEERALRAARQAKHEEQRRQEEAHLRVERQRRAIAERWLRETAPPDEQAAALDAYRAEFQFAADFDDDRLRRSPAFAGWLYRWLQGRGVAIDVQAETGPASSLGP